MTDVQRVWPTVSEGDASYVPNDAPNTVIEIPPPVGPVAGTSAVTLGDENRRALSSVPPCEATRAVTVGAAPMPGGTKQDMALSENQRACRQLVPPILPATEESYAPKLLPSRVNAACPTVGTSPALMCVTEGAA